MKARSQSFRCLRWILGLLAAFYLIAGIGWLRERHDQHVKDERIGKTAKGLMERIHKVKFGDPLEKVLQLFPDAYTNLNGDTGEVIVQVTYSSNRTGTRWAEHNYSFVSGKMVGPATGGVGVKIIDSVAPGPWYYFQRAWRSPVDD